jgi:hypothetical protein
MALDAPTRHLTIDNGTRHTIERVDATLQQPGISVPLPDVYERNGTRFEPTCSHVIAAEASDTSNATNKATTRTSLFVRAPIAHRFSKALVGARFAGGDVIS